MSKPDLIRLFTLKGKPNRRQPQVLIPAGSRIYVSGTAESYIVTFDTYAYPEVPDPIDTSRDPHG